MFFGWTRVSIAFFGSSSGHCLVDRACGTTKWIPHGTVLADWLNTRTDRARGLHLDSGPSLGPRYS